LFFFHYTSFFLSVLIAFSSGGVYSGYSDVLVMTQRMAELNRERIEFYKDRFRRMLSSFFIDDEF